MFDFIAMFKQAAFKFKEQPSVLNQVAQETAERAAPSTAAKPTTALAKQVHNYKNLGVNPTRMDKIKDAVSGAIGKIKPKHVLGGAAVVGGALGGVAAYKQSKQTAEKLQVRNRTGLAPVSAAQGAIDGATFGGIGAGVGATFGANALGKKFHVPKKIMNGVNAAALVGGAAGGGHIIGKAVGWSNAQHQKNHENFRDKVKARFDKYRGR